MADITEALGAALSARYGWSEPKSPASSTRGRQARMRRIMAAHGGDKRAAAKASGIGYSTWTRLLRPKQHAAARTVRKLEAAFSRTVMAPAIAAKIAAKGYPKVISVSAVVVRDGASNQRGSNRTNIKEDGPPGGYREQGWRTFNAENLRTKLVVDAWLHYGNDAAVDALGREIVRVYGGQFTFEGDQVGVEFSGRRR